MPTASTADFEAMLDATETIAVVGCSANPDRTSHRIARYLQDAGFQVIPVNPTYDEVLGETCYPDLPSVPEGHTIDIVNIFRAPEHTADMVRDALRRIEQTGERPVIWTQRGVSSDEARQLAEEAGLPYVKDRCIMVEHSRLVAS
jgi:hypothetical protein